MLMQWSAAQRDGVRDYLGEAQPNNHSILVNNIEDIMPPNVRRGFEKLFARVAAPRVLVEEPWVVWSAEHSGWWAPNSRGYTPHLLRAGLYAEVDAKAIEQRANGHGKTNEKAMSLSAAIADERERCSPGACVLDALSIVQPAQTPATV